MLKCAVLVILSALTLMGADVTGTWEFEVQTDAGTGNPTFTLKQEGEKLTGTYSGMLGTASVRGTVKGKEVVIEFETDAVGERATVRYNGTLEADDRMKGTVTLGEYKGTFTAKKKSGQ